MKLDIALQKYLLKMELKNRSSATVKNYQFHLNIFIEWLNTNYGLDESKYLRASHLESYQAYICSLGNEPAYTNQKIISTNGFINWLINEGEAVKNLEKKLECLSTPDALPKIISNEEFEQVISCVDKSTREGMRDFAILTLLDNACPRVDGLRKLNISDFNLEKREVKIWGKGLYQYITTYTEHCRSVLHYYLQYTRPRYQPSNSEQAMFLSKRRSRMSIRAIQQMVKKYAKLSGIESHLSVHTFRRNVATMLVNHPDCDVFTASKALGHRNIESLKRYARLDTNRLAEVIQKCHPRG